MPKFDNLRKMFAPNQQERIAEAQDVLARRDAEESQGIDRFSLGGFAKGLMANPPKLSDIRMNLGLNNEGSTLESVHNLNKLRGGDILENETKFDSEGNLAGMSYGEKPQDPRQLAQMEMLKRLRGTGG